MAVGFDQHHQSTVGGKADKFDMFDWCVMFWGQHQAGALGKPGQRTSDAVKHGADVTFIAVKRGVDFFLVQSIQLPGFKQAVDEQAQAKLRGDTPSRDVGESSKPRCSRSCMTLRMVAALTFSFNERVRVREPTGSPESR